MTVTTPSPVDLFAEALRFGADGRLFTAPPCRDDRVGDDWQLVTFACRTDSDVHADHWEMHPAGEEAVCCARGAIRVFLRASDPDGTDELVSLRAGEAVVIPRATWHRIELDEPSDITSIGRVRGTQLERRSPEADAAPDEKETS